MHLAVEMPRLPASQGEARTKARIGRKVAALFGISGEREDGDAGAGRAWLTSYGELTMNELLLGGPQRMKQQVGGVRDTGVFEPSVHGRRAKPVHAGADGLLGVGEVVDAAISPALIRGYGPDPKAAVTLAGVNYVLRPLTEALKTVLTELTFPDERLLVGTTAMLLSEAFRSQPLLMLAGVQASHIQLALRLQDLVAVASPAPPSEEYPWLCSRTDLPLVRLNEQGAASPSGIQLLTPRVTPVVGEASGPRAAPTKNPLQPYRLELIDAVWDALTTEAPIRPRHHQAPARLVPITRPAKRARQRWDSSHVILTRDRALAQLTTLTENIVFGLGDGVGGTRVVLRRCADGRFVADFPGLATRPARVLADSVLGNYFLDNEDAPPVEDSGPSPVPAFDPDRWRNEPPLVRRVALWAYHCAERFVSSGAWSERVSHNKNLARRVEQCKQLADTAREMFGRDDPLAVELRAFATRFRMERDRKRFAGVNGGGEVPPDLGANVRAFEKVTDHLLALHERKSLSDSHLVETLQSTLAELLRVKQHVDEALGAKIGQMLQRYYHAYLKVQLRLVGRSGADPLPKILADLAADGAWEHPTHAAILEASPNLALAVAEFELPDPLALALRIQENTRLRRKELFHRENVWPLYRGTLVDKAKLLLRLCDRSAGAVREQANAELIELTEELFGEELGDEWRSAPARLHRIWERLPAVDALLLQVVEYLRVSDSHELDRQGIGLRLEVLQVLAHYQACIRERLAAEPWSAHFAEYRAVLEEALTHTQTPTRQHS